MLSHRTTAVFKGIEMIFLVQALLFFLELGVSEASAVTDPHEVGILRTLSEKMGVITLWNLDTDPCSTSPSTNDSYGGSYLACDCSFDNGSTCHITKIAIYRMNVKSELPVEIGGLIYLTFLDVNGNNLNGQIPSELGNLKNLTHLGLGTNHFTGELPSELGNLVQLRDLFLDTNQLSGEIPSTLANLRKLQALWMFNNNFSGSIPNMFGNLTELQELRIYGNPLQGPIPPSIRDLRSIGQMYMGDISNGGSFPYGLENLKSLTALSLRNCELHGSILTNLGQLTNLTFLDLSFNKLIGRIPDSFGNLMSLQTLYLGRNNLSGDLPQELGKLNSLKYLDVSYNQLSGAPPSWLNQPYIIANLIWNFFNATNTVNIFSSNYFNCHFSNTLCQRTLPGNNVGFAINVGGKEVKTLTSTYDDDTKVHGYTSFYTNDKRTWAVSQTGGFDQESFLDIVNTTSAIQGTHDPFLYQTARSSSSSLKYYGLEMKNGQYVVDLHFAEIVLTDGSLGTRIFDIFVQDVLIQKDFNIQDAADGSFKAFVLSVPVMVSNNYLEIHFFWDGKGTCCYPRRWAYGPLISAIQVYPASNIATSNDKPAQTLAIVSSSIGAVLIALCLVVAWYWRINKNSSILSTEDQAVRSFEIQQGVNHFSYGELKTATNDFHVLNKLGEGGYGAVYKGVLTDGMQVAVKMLSPMSKQGDREFLNEVRIISSVQQRNLVKLRGCCVERGSRILVYEFVENNNLSQVLLDAQSAMSLNWNTRFNIALGIARGLAYLHEESQTRIIHRDIKASNILLDKNFNPKIADFGLARFFEDEKTHVSTRVAGTIGYMAPEYAFRGQLSEKADVFSYGVLILEIFSGRSNMNFSLTTEQTFLLEWAWHLYEDNHMLDIMDSRLNREFPNDIALRVIEVALTCTQAAPSARPSMGRVVAMLLGDVKVTPLESKPMFITDVKLRKYRGNAIETAGPSSGSASIATFSTEVESR